MSDEMGQPTQEEIEAYYAQLREAPVADLLMQCIGMLAAGAEAKLGRVDARTLIDAMGAMVQIGEPHLGEAVEQLKGAVAQLQMGQVQVERQLKAEGQPAEGTPEGAAASQPAAGQPSAQPGQPAAGKPPAAEQAPPKPSPTDKLWIPGR